MSCVDFGLELPWDATLGFRRLKQGKAEAMGQATMSKSLRYPVGIQTSHILPAWHSD